MNALIGIRREDKNRWERRVPLIPEHVRELKQEHGIEVWLQPSQIRIFSDEEYIGAGARVVEDLSPCPLVFAIKEIPIFFFKPGQAYVFFSHTVKGQAYNMPMLKRMLELKCQLIDYERVVDKRGRRLIFFGRHAGLAGMIDTLWAFGKRLDSEGIRSPFSEIRQAVCYQSLAEAKGEISKVGERIKSDGLPESLTPLICGFAGYGNVSQGAQEILDLLPTQQIDPEKIKSVFKKPNRKRVYKVVFKEQHMAEPISPKDRFELHDYYDHPEKYRGRFHSYLPYLALLMNCIYWSRQYPRLVTKEYLRQLYGGTEKPRLRVVGDISCDIEGAIECTLHATDPGNPVFVYDPFTDRASDGYEGRGPVVLAVDNLPCELPRESSTHFSEILKPFVQEIAKADFSVDFTQCKLSPVIKNAVIVYQGELTPTYRYLQKYL